MHPLGRLLSCSLALLVTAGAPRAARAAPVEASVVSIAQTGSAMVIPGLLARPAGAGPFPAVLILHGCAGEGRPERAAIATFAEDGYVALAIDTLRPQGASTACNGAVKGASRNAARYATRSLAWLAKLPYVRADRLAVVGFSMGAIAVLDLVDDFAPHAAPPGLRAAVAYYPACRRRDGAATVPLLILDGDDDDWTPAPPCRALAAAAAAAGASVKITTYPGATHAFNIPRDGPATYLGHTLRYDAAAARDAAAKTKAFLARYLS